MTSGGLIVNTGKQIFLDRMYNAVPTRTAPAQFKAGVGTTTPAVTQTDLAHPIPISGTEQIDTCDVTTGWTDSADMTVSVNSTTFKQGLASLNLTKDGVASATAYTEKTTTNLAFGVKEFGIWFYVKDAAALAKLAVTACLTIRFGSDSGNYYQWTKDASFFAVGWNLIDGLTIATSTATGSPDQANCDYTYVAITATGAAITWSAGDMAMDDIKLISSNDHLKIFETGYPSVDYVNLQATIRCRLSTVEANGYGITEVGVFNSDGSPVMESRDLFASISKSDSDELIFEIKTLVG